MKTISVEEDISESVINRLQDKGHIIDIVKGNERMKFGGAQVAKYDHQSWIQRASNVCANICRIGI